MHSKLTVQNSRDVIKALKRAGFRQLARRGKGSHTFLFRENPPTGINVPLANPVRRGTLRAIIRQAGLSVEEFNRLLK